ncbi:uncharacterized protein LOC130795984 isoform X1 [Actinidia eriantha]|uniref:uncharacterized protein LOC130795984 isoform X1 n=2 Tax=Actinidia eriantha TaxID=165200 RepID=UPI00258D6818|nr:uncharacterized protein LOC130795984 isoform X1 [Actinidia eriantha]
MSNNLSRRGVLVGVCGEMRIAIRLPFTHPKQVSTDISSLVRGSNVYWRGRSSAASNPSDIPNLQKGGKRVSRDVRRAMVESFVDKYRAMNAGKFPTISHARNQVGGSHYVIREILQELEYKSEITSMNTRDDDVLGKKAVKVNKASTDVEEISGIQSRVDAIHKDTQIEAVSDLNVGDSGHKNVRAKEGPETLTLFEKTMSQEVVKAKPVDDSSNYAKKLKHETEVDFRQHPEKLEHDLKKRSHSEGVMDLDGPKPKSEQHEQSPELDKFVRDVSENQIDDQEHLKKSSVWGNLKSLADGFINMWKKL